ncbi:unnamed protein product, partial [marine sediment metagenome]
FNENSFEKTEKNVRRLIVLSESMSGILELQLGDFLLDLITFYNYFGT